jgi:hypothetical protein
MKNMSSRCVCRAAMLAAALALPLAAAANQGLVPLSGEWLWPQLQARITVQTVSLAPVGPVALARGAGLESAAPQRGVQGGGIFGDYVFSTPSFGNFRATSGVMLGAPAGAPVFSGSLGPRLGVTVYDAGVATSQGSAESAQTLPYLGLGYSSPALWRSLSVNADVGLVAGRPGGLPGLGRAIFGNQPTDAALRELRLAPVLQLGMRYSF